MHEKEVPTVSQSSKRLDYSSLLAFKDRDYAVWYTNHRYLQFSLMSQAGITRYSFREDLVSVHGISSFWR